MQKIMDYIPAFSLAVLLAVASAPSQSRADIITFDGLNAFASSSDFITADDFKFTSNPSGGFIEFGNRSSMVQNGSNHLLNANNSFFTLTRIDDEAFSLSSLDLAGSHLLPFGGSRWASSMTLTGTLSLGGTVTQTISLPSTNDFVTHAIVGFSDVVSILFTAAVNTASPQSHNREFQLDNLVVDTAAVTVPAPGALALLGLGLIGLGARRRVA